VFSALATATVAAGLVVTGLAGVAAAGPHGSSSTFPIAPLAPGNSTSTQIPISAAGRTLLPYLQVLNLRNTCDLDCTAHSPQLSDLIDVTATAPDGTHWTRSLTSLASPTALSGGSLRAGAATRTYRLAASLPHNVGNEGEGLSSSFDLRWGLMTSDGTAVTSVLGETYTRGKGTPSSVLLVPIDGHELPATGFNIALTLAFGVSLMATGVLLTTAARRRWRGRRITG
jgi:hypothetical protein